MSKIKGGLGRGLSALIRPTEDSDENTQPDVQNTQDANDAPGGYTPHIPPPAQPTVDASKASINDIELTRIRPNPFQPRADFDPEALDELKQSIQQNGIIQPITVRKVEGEMYEVISGERRLRASMEIGLATIPSYVIEVNSDQEMLELALVENLQREHLNPIEIAISYQRLTNDIGLSAEDIAKKVAKDRTTVINFLRLLKLPFPIQMAVRKGELSTGHARALLSITDQQLQMQIFERVAKSDLSVRQVEKLVRDIGKAVQKKPAAPGTQATGGSAVANIEEKVRQILATKVKVNVRDGGKGEITIEFYSHDDLGRLFDLLSTIQL